MKSLAFVFCLLCFLPAVAQQTALDSAFGTNGRLNTQGLPGIDSDYPVFCAQQADGKLLTLASYIYVSPTPTQDIFGAIRIQRWLNDGRPDSTFNATGTFEYVTNSNGLALGIRALANGKILIVARAHFAAYTLRLKPDGTLDSSYHGAGGGVHASPQVWDAAILADGSVAFAGNKFIATGIFDLALFKLDTAGNPDAALGTSGTAIYNFGPGTTTFGIRIAEATSGKFLVSAMKELAGPRTDSVGVLRVLASGSLDLTFGNGGSVFKHIPHTWIRAEDAVEGQNGSVTFAAYYRPLNNTLYHRTLFRTIANGTMDAAFGIGGVRELTSVPLLEYLHERWFL